MKERPILFSTPMVRAILEGRKTMTRRAINPQPFSDDFELGMYNPIKTYLNGEQYPGPDTFGIYTDWWSLKSKFVQIGDRLWVRETWANISPNVEGDNCPDFKYKADDPEFKTKWKPSIFMPREASRITLEITNIRVERLQDISTEDALNEGITGLETVFVSPVEKFMSLWQSINGPESWKSNPYVWVIEFKVINK